MIQVVKIPSIEQMEVSLRLKNLKSPMSCLMYNLPLGKKVKKLIFLGIMSIPNNLLIITYLTVYQLFFSKTSTYLLLI